MGRIEARDPTSYRTQKEMPFCPCCGHESIIKALDKAMVNLELDPHNTVIVTDIGCIGMADPLFKVNTLHGLHGRSVTYATGIKLAKPELDVIVLVGDGGCGIGAHHLIRAAQLNIDLTVLVANNFNFGMTGGQSSPTTPLERVTSTAPYGNLTWPMDICGTAQVNGASFVARTFSIDEDLPETITRAIKRKGFSIVDIWELCPSRLKLKKGDLRSLMESQRFESGIIYEAERPEYNQAYLDATMDLEGSLQLATLEVKFHHNLDAQHHLIIAGDAGMKVASTGAAFSRGAVLSGAWATQHGDYPVTVKSGFSVSAVTLSPKETTYLGPHHPNTIVVLSELGLKRVQGKIKKLGTDDHLYINSELASPETSAQVSLIDFSRVQSSKRSRAIVAMTVVLRDLELQLYPLSALEEALSQSKYAKENMPAFEAGKKLKI